jgi:hypothetical protein
MKMAVKKVEEKKEEMEEVILPPEEKFEEKEDGLTEVPPPEVEATEEEVQQEEVEAPKEEKGDGGVGAILEGFNMLREELRSKGEAPPPAIAREPGETDEELAARFNEEIFKENPFGVFSKAVDKRARKIVEEEVGPILGSIMESAFENAEFRLKNDPQDGPIYLRFEGEVKKTLKGLTPAQQKNPAVLKAVFERVRSIHSKEIIDMEVERRLKEAGKKQPAAARKPVGEGGSTVLPSASPGTGGRRVLVTKKRLSEIKTRAGQLGIDYKELLAREGQ